MASDGVWDVIEPDECAKVVADALSSGAGEMASGRLAGLAPTHSNDDAASTAARGQQGQQGAGAGAGAGAGGSSSGVVVGRAAQSKLAAAVAQVVVDAAAGVLKNNDDVTALVATLAVDRVHRPKMPPKVKL